MAIIQCPSCQKKVSDKSKICGYCQYDFINQSSVEGLTQEQLTSQKKLAHIKKKYSLQMQAMSGIILILLGVSLWYFSGRKTESYSDFLKLGLIAIGAIWYLTTRIRVIAFKKNT